MSHIEEIEKSVEDLPASELRKFRQWFATFDAGAWDAQIEADAAAGKFDSLADAAIANHRNGETTEL